MAKLDELVATSREVGSPRFSSKSKVAFGGIDPLGLRAINFDLMDRILPGLNNVARHIRPFVLTAWSWRRALEIARKVFPDHVERDELRKCIASMNDFVDRVEVIYLWSQILRDNDADLPGKGSIDALSKQESYVFSGPNWETLKKSRVGSSLRAAVNYGPGLRALKWLDDDPNVREIRIPTPAAEPALDAFETAIAECLDHPAFNSFGSVEVSADDVVSWSEAWALENPTDIERSVAAKLLTGNSAPIDRQRGLALVIAASESKWDGTDGTIDSIRHVMADLSENEAGLEYAETLDLWRRLQTRQAFRLALETLFAWITTKLEGHARPTSYLVQEFLEAVTDRPSEGTTSEWLGPSAASTVNPVDVLEILKGANRNRDDAPSQEVAVAAALSFCLRADLDDDSKTRPDRLPLARAKRELRDFEQRPVAEFIRHVIEAWVIAQHTYWSVGRGLADARANGKRLLRLRVVLEEGGWSLAIPRTAATPFPTGDRLKTALVLANEAGLLVEEIV